MGACILVGSRLRDFREAETMPGVGRRLEEIAGRAYRTPRQRLRISTASFIGCREEISGRHGRLHPCRKSPSRLPRRRNRAGCREPSQRDRRARLSDAAPAASDKHRLLHRMSRRRVLGPNRGSIVIGSRLRDFREGETVPGVGSRVKEIAGRAYRTPRQRLRISTASFIGCREGPFWVQIVAQSPIESRLRDFR